MAKTNHFPPTILYISPLISSELFVLYFFSSGLKMMMLMRLFIVTFQQQVQCWIWVCKHDLTGGHMEVVQGVSSSTLGGFQLKKNL